MCDCSEPRRGDNNDRGRSRRRTSHDELDWLPYVYASALLLVCGFAYSIIGKKKIGGISLHTVLATSSAKMLHFFKLGTTESKPSESTTDNVTIVKKTNIISIFKKTGNWLKLRTSKSSESVASEKGEHEVSDSVPTKVTSGDTYSSSRETDVSITKSSTGAEETSSSSKASSRTGLTFSGKKVDGSEKIGVEVGSPISGDLSSKTTGLHVEKTHPDKTSETKRRLTVEYPGTTNTKTGVLLEKRSIDMQKKTGSLKTASPITSVSISEESDYDKRSGKTLDGSIGTAKKYGTMRTSTKTDDSRSDIGSSKSETEASDAVNKANFDRNSFNNDNLQSRKPAEASFDKYKSKPGDTSNVSSETSRDKISSGDEVSENSSSITASRTGVGTNESGVNKTRSEKSVESYSDESRRTSDTTGNESSISQFDKGKKTNKSGTLTGSEKPESKRAIRDSTGRSDKDESKSVTGALSGYIQTESRTADDTRGSVRESSDDTKEFDNKSGAGRLYPAETVPRRTSDTTRGSASKSSEDTKEFDGEKYGKNTFTSLNSHKTESRRTVGSTERRKSSDDIQDLDSGQRNKNKSGFNVKEASSYEKVESRIGVDDKDQLAKDSMIGSNSPDKKPNSPDSPKSRRRRTYENINKLPSKTPVDKNQPGSEYFGKNKTGTLEANIDESRKSMDIIDVLDKATNKRQSGKHKSKSGTGIISDYNKDASTPSDDTDSSSKLTVDKRRSGSAYSIKSKKGGLAGSERDASKKSMDSISDIPIKSNDDKNDSDIIDFKSKTTLGKLPLKIPAVSKDSYGKHGKKIIDTNNSDTTISDTRSTPIIEESERQDAVNIFDYLKNLFKGTTSDDVPSPSDLQSRFDSETGKFSHKPAKLHVDKKVLSSVDSKTEVNSRRSFEPQTSNQSKSDNTRTKTRSNKAYLNKYCDQLKRRLQENQSKDNINNRDKDDKEHSQENNAAKTSDSKPKFCKDKLKWP